MAPLTTEAEIVVFWVSSLKALVEYSIATVGIAKFPVEVQVIVLGVPTSTSSPPAGWETVLITPRRAKRAEVLATVASLACRTLTRTVEEAGVSVTVHT